MADSYGVQTGMMRDTTNFISENGVDNFDTASQGSRDDCVEHDAGFMEDRFRVDRKKLEQMLQLGKPLTWVWVFSLRTQCFSSCFGYKSECCVA